MIQPSSRQAGRTRLGGMIAAALLALTLASVAEPMLGMVDADGARRDLLLFVLVVAGHELHARRRREAVERMIPSAAPASVS
jgi:hypothetical protein